MPSKPTPKRKTSTKIFIAVILLLAIVALRYWQLHPKTSFVDVRTIVRIDTNLNSPFKYRLYYNKPTQLQQGGFDINQEGYCVGDTFYIEGDLKTGLINPPRRWRTPKNPFSK